MDFLKENSHFKIINSLYNKCLKLPFDAIEGVKFTVEDCIENNLEQKFTTQIVQNSF